MVEEVAKKQKNRSCLPMKMENDRNNTTSFAYLMNIQLMLHLSSCHHYTIWNVSDAHDTRYRVGLYIWFQYFNVIIQYKLGACRFSNANAQEGLTSVSSHRVYQFRYASLIFHNSWYQIHRRFNELMSITLILISTEKMKDFEPRSTYAF